MNFIEAVKAVKDGKNVTTSDGRRVTIDGVFFFVGGHIPSVDTMLRDGYRIVPETYDVTEALKRMRAGGKSRCEVNGNVYSFLCNQFDGGMTLCRDGREVTSVITTGMIDSKWSDA